MPLEESVFSEILYFLESSGFTKTAKKFRQETGCNAAPSSPLPLAAVIQNARRRYCKKASKRAANTAPSGDAVVPLSNKAKEEAEENRLLKEEVKNVVLQLGTWNGAYSESKDTGKKRGAGHRDKVRTTRLTVPLNGNPSGAVKELEHPTTKRLKIAVDTSNTKNGEQSLSKSEREFLKESREKKTRLFIPCFQGWLGFRLLAGRRHCRKKSD